MTRAESATRRAGDALDLALGYAITPQRRQGACYHSPRRGFWAARLGDWIASSVEIQRIGAKLAFANCYLVSGEKRIVRASAIFARAEKDA
jgi:hypothetical protein